MNYFAKRLVGFVLLSAATIFSGISAVSFIGASGSYSMQCPDGSDCPDVMMVLKYAPMIFVASLVTMYLGYRITRSKT